MVKLNQKELKLAYAALAVVCVLWGTTYTGIRVGVESIPPMLLSSMRLITAGLCFLAFWSRTINWRSLTKSFISTQAIAGLFLFSLGNGLVCLAEVGIASSLAAIIGSLIPIWVLLINQFINRTEKPTLVVIAGMIIGLGGIILIFGEHVGSSTITSISGVLLMFAAGVSWAFGSVWLKRRHSTADSFSTAGFQMLIGGVILIPVSLLTEPWIPSQFSARSVIALAYLISFGSMLAYLCFLYALKRLPVTIVALYAYINPIVALLFGWLLLDEKVNLRIVAGIIITLLGVYLVNRGAGNIKDEPARKNSEG
jgi:drug/metabolite transporter (DMT)-like permease